MRGAALRARAAAPRRMTSSYEPAARHCVPYAQRKRVVVPHVSEGPEPPESLHGFSTGARPRSEHVGGSRCETCGGAAATGTDALAEPGGAARGGAGGGRARSTRARFSRTARSAVRMLLPARARAPVAAVVVPWAANGEGGGRASPLTIVRPTMLLHQNGDAPARGARVRSTSGRDARDRGGRSRLAANDATAEATPSDRTSTCVAAAARPAIVRRPAPHRPRANVYRPRARAKLAVQEARRPSLTALARLVPALTVARCARVVVGEFSR